MKSKDIVTALEKNVTSYNKKLEDCNEHNLKYGVISSLIKAGIALDYIIPFLVSTVFMFNLFKHIDKTPFKTDIKKKYASSYSMMSSNGYERETISYENKFENNSIEYSSPWIINEHNLYERDVIVYSFNPNNLDYSMILSMSNEELASNYEICDYKKIQKSVLSIDDHIFDEETVVINMVDNRKHSKEEKESTLEVLIDTLLFAFNVLLSSYIIDRMKNIFIKETIADKLKKVHKKYKPITSKDIECAKRILEVRRENLELVQEEKGWQKKYE